MKNMTKEIIMKLLKSGNIEDIRLGVTIYNESDVWLTNSDILDIYGAHHRDLIVIISANDLAIHTLDRTNYQMCTDNFPLKTKDYYGNKRMPNN